MSSVYQRYASGSHDDAYFKSANININNTISDIPAATANVSATNPNNSSNYSPSTNLAYQKALTANDDILNSPLNDDTPLAYIQLNPLSGQFDPYNENMFALSSNSISEWLSIFPNAAYFIGYDDLLFENILIIVYESSKTGKISTLSITKFGVVSYENIILDSRSRFWPACENLIPKFQKSNVRRALAITLLKNNNRLSNHPGHFVVNKHWDETTAGNLASDMSLIIDKRPDELGYKLLELGLLQQHGIQSVILDVIYDNSSISTNAKIVEENNKLVFLLGTQLDQLFDPLLEYSPEQMDIQYNVPNSSDYEPPLIFHNTLIDSIVGEIINVQTNYTMGLVGLLQNFVIPLRVYVLASSTGTGITKINQVFPPTIDEITRINCILHENLEKAATLGYVQVFKVLGIVLPYFYKAFIRHEANLKNFNTRLNKFTKKNHKKIFENNEINKNELSVREIESIISGSLLELPRLKLIMRRLYDTISIEKLKLNNFETNIDDDPEIKIINYYYKIAIEVIDAFGYSENKEEKRLGSQQRIFTPTGKLLTELASDWPSELQYGWLSRKVVGIFELRNVKEEIDNFHNTDILIIFSDHLLFLNIVDDNYYNDSSSNQKTKKLSLPDVLMHSLVNEKPLPSLSQFPSMKVKFWCDINDVVASTYKSLSSKNLNIEEFLRFINISKIGFKSNNLDSKTFTSNYQVIKNSNNAISSGNKIIELINKSKVLHKSQPFHLFKSYDPLLNVYSTAHDKEAYSNEKSKSPFALFLNTSLDNPQSYFDDNPQVYLILSTSFINDYKIHITGLNRTNNFTINEIIFADDLTKCLKEIISKNSYFLFSSYNLITEVLTHGYKDDLNYYTKYFTHSVSGKQANFEPIRQTGDITLPKENPNSRLFTNNSEDNLVVSKPIMLSKPSKSISQPKSQPKSQVIARSSQSAAQDVNLVSKSTKNTTNRRKSIIKKLFDSFKKSDTDEPLNKFQKTEVGKNHRKSKSLGSVVESHLKTKDSSHPTSGDASKQALQKISQQSPKQVSQQAPHPPIHSEAPPQPPQLLDHLIEPSQPQMNHSYEPLQSHEPRDSEVKQPQRKMVRDISNISNTNIPRGEKKRFSHLYKPMPELTKSETITSEMNSHIKNPAPTKPQNRVSSFKFPLPSSPPDHLVQTTTATTSNPATTNININENFKQNKQSDITPASQVTDSSVIVKPQTKELESVSESIPSVTTSPIFTKRAIPKAFSTQNTAMNNKVHLGGDPRVSSNFSEESKNKSLIEENVTALDTIPYRRVRPEKPSQLETSVLQAPYKARSTSYNLHRYDNIKVDDFYKDGETNWVSISRENSSLLEHEIKALKEATDMNSFEVLSVRNQSCDNNVATPHTDHNKSNNEELNPSDNDTESLYYSPSQVPTPAFDDHTILEADSLASSFGYQTWRGQEDSFQSLKSFSSLSTSQYIEEFNKLIERRFAKYGKFAEPQFDNILEETELMFDNGLMSDNETLRFDSSLDYNSRSDVALSSDDSDSSHDNENESESESESESDSELEHESEESNDSESIEAIVINSFDTESEYEDNSNDQKTIHTVQTTQTIQSIKDDKPTKPNLILNLNSSEEEYFSSDEFAQTLNLIHNNSQSFVNSKAETNYSMRGSTKTDSPITFNSSSSDATIINEYIHEAIKQPIQEKSGARLLSQSSASFNENKKLEIPGINIRYDSVAYLSDIVNGTVNFNLDDENDI